MPPTVRSSNRRSSGSIVSSRPAELIGHPNSGLALEPGGGEPLCLLTEAVYLERHRVARAEVREPSRQRYALRGAGVHDIARLQDEKLGQVPNQVID